MDTTRTVNDSLESLALEANHLHRALFGCDAPEELRCQYADAVTSAPLAAVPPVEMARLIADRVDLEALELAMRRRHPRNALTQRFQVVCYLAEARTGNYDRFVSDDRRIFAAWLTLVGHVVRSAYKLAKGHVLLRSHGLR